MKRVIKASNDPMFYDKFLPLEHSIDVASGEAWKLYRILTAQHDTTSASVIKEIATELDSSISRIRKARHFSD